MSSRRLQEPHTNCLTFDRRPPRYGESSTQRDRSNESAAIGDQASVRP
jgi:hypothetical protein